MYLHMHCDPRVYNNLIHIIPVYVSSLLIISVISISTFPPTMRKAQYFSGNQTLDSEDMKGNANDKQQNK